MAQVVQHAWTHRPRAQGGTDPVQVELLLPAVRMTMTTNLTVTDGNYYALAQTTGASPSADGVADLFEFWNDSGDGSGVFDTKTVSTGEVLKFMAAPDESDQLYMVAYDAAVTFTNSSIDTTTVTVSHYLGRGVGGGSYSFEFEALEAVSASNVSGTGNPTVRLAGTIPVTGQWVDGSSGSDFTSLPTISPILLVEGGTPTVDQWVGTFTVLTKLF